MNVIYNRTLFKGFSPHSVDERHIALQPIVTVLLLSGRSQFVNYEGTFLARVRTLFNYLSIYTLSDIMYKIRSRQSEAIRNDKYLSIGLGRGMAGELYLFINPISQFYQSSVVVPTMLSRRIHLDRLDISGSNSFLFNLVGENSANAAKSLFENLLGFSAYSGRIISESDLVSAFNEAERVIRFVAQSVNSDSLVRCHYNKQKTIIQPKRRGLASRKKAVLFGYGNYAKSVVLPYLRDFIAVERVHEIDPVQLLNCPISDTSTSPVSDFNTVFDVWLIAGYHHTHVDLALAAFKDGAKAIIEKPLATNRLDFQRFRDFVSTCSAVFFLCFQKRYLSFNEYIFTDFKIQKGSPINYRAIVYEVPLDTHHWYNWPNSRSRIISNGCHWIDHFFYLNRYSKAVEYWARKLSNDTIVCFIKLMNGAVFSLTLTDSGSKRQGVREYVEVSVDGYRAIIQDSMHYESENNVEIIRRKRMSKLQCLKDMYQQIGKAVSGDGPGDDLESLVSTEMSLLLDEMLEYSVEGVF